MATDLEMQLKQKYDHLANGTLSYQDFSAWFEKQKWPSTGETDRMLESVELTRSNLAIHAGQPEELSRSQLAKIGDYLHGRSDVKPGILSQDGMSRDELRHQYEDNQETYDRR